MAVDCQRPGVCDCAIILFPGILRCEEIPMDRLRQFAAAPLILLALTLIEPASIAQMDEQSRAIKALIESFERALSTRDMRMLEQLWAHELMSWSSARET